MPYVSRDIEGQVESVHRRPSEAADEFVDDRHPDLLEFLGASADDGHFSRLDAGFVRVIEDLVDVLLARNVINVTDLPHEAQVKLFARKGYRDRVARNALHLFDGDPGDVI